MTISARKICLLGDFAVGKTSLVARFIMNVFSDRYLTTVGVKVDTREVQVGTESLKLVIWDLAGTAQLNGAGRAYVQGAHGVIYVCDLTRRETLESVHTLKASIDRLIGVKPSILLANKSDLLDRAEIQDADLAGFEGYLATHRASAKSGEQVEQAFRALAEAVK